MSLAESKQVENSEKLKFYNFNQRILDVITFCITLLACELFSNKQTAAELKPFKKNTFIKRGTVNLCHFDGKTS